MAAVPPLQRFPTSHLITVASALRLGDLLRLHCSRRLQRFLLCSSSREGYCSTYLRKIKDIWCQRSCPQRTYSLLETLADAFGESFSSYSYLFNGEESERKRVDKVNLMFNTSGGRPFNGRPWTNVIIAFNILVYVAQVASQGRLILWGAKVNSLIDKGQLWRLATSSFLHSNVAHLMVNSYALNNIGPAVEKLCGPKRYLAVYFTSALACSLMSYRFCQSPAVGASGAIFGLVGSFGVFVLRHRSIFGDGKQELQQIARVIAVNIVLGILVQGIDNWGHLGGLLGGAAASWFLGPAWQYEFQSDDGRRVFTDRAPVFHFINWRRLK